ncbi:hypothetical protein DID80_00460 [Candidatus Marinamargulisbacteria bacterium SCGC AAA071-K20]|nr:hypothetical protein DID80_00460 [Candidatus Marinamargulisbacteria bacterium SCGC AAA071-K20]
MIMAYKILAVPQTAGAQERDIEADFKGLSEATLEGFTGSQPACKEYLHTMLNTILTAFYIPSKNKVTLISNLVDATVNSLKDLLSEPTANASTLNFKTIGPMVLRADPFLENIINKAEKFVTQEDKMEAKTTLKCAYSLMLLHLIQRLLSKRIHAKFLSSNIPTLAEATVTFKNAGTLFAGLIPTAVSLTKGLPLAMLPTAIAPFFSYTPLTEGLKFAPLLYSLYRIYNNTQDSRTGNALKRYSFDTTRDIAPKAETIERANGVQPEYSYTRVSTKYNKNSQLVFQMPWPKLNSDFPIPSLKPCDRALKMNEHAVKYYEDNFISPEDPKRTGKLQKIREANFGGLAVLISPEDMDPAAVKEVTTTITLLFIGDDRFDKLDTIEGNSFSLTRKLVDEFKAAFISTQDGEVQEESFYREKVEEVIEHWEKSLIGENYDSYVAKQKSKEKLTNTEAELLTLVQKDLFPLESSLEPVKIKYNNEKDKMIRIYGRLIKLWAENGHQHRLLIDPENSNPEKTTQRLRFAYNNFTNYLKINPIEVSDRTTNIANNGVSLKSADHVLKDRESSGAVIAVVGLILAHSKILIDNSDLTDPSFINMLQATNWDYIYANDFKSLKKDSDDGTFDGNVMWSIIFSKLPEEVQLKYMMAMQCLKSAVSKDTALAHRDTMEDQISGKWGQEFRGLLKRARDSDSTGEKLFSPLQYDNFINLVNASNLEGATAKRALSLSAQALQEKFANTLYIFNKSYGHYASSTLKTPEKAPQLGSILLRGMLGQRIWYGDLPPYIDLPNTTKEELRPFMSLRYINATTT